jgi:hypothetical protein
MFTGKERGETGDGFIERFVDEEVGCNMCEGKGGN